MDWQQLYVQVKKLHPKARHHCFAYRFGIEGTNFRINDDGEPSGTAGRPILGQIDSYGLTNVLIVVVRYFGGILLGTSGLINAYKSSTADALARAVIIEKVPEISIRLSFGYHYMGELLDVLKKLNCRVITQNFQTEPYLDICIPKNRSLDTITSIKAHLAKVSHEEALLIDDLPDLRISIIE
jgi:uncharacterized YigZ family protein